MLALGEQPTPHTPAFQSLVPSLVEVATLEWGREERETGGRQRGPERERVPCGAMLEPSSPASGEGGGEEGTGGERRSFLRHALSSKPPAGRLPPAMHPQTPPWGVRLPRNRGHAGSADAPSRTYRGTGRCSQGRGLYNSGWHRSWPGNLGNLMERGRVVSDASPTAQTLIGEAGSEPHTSLPTS